jgi:hypothetical protein
MPDMKTKKLQIVLLVFAVWGCGCHYLDQQAKEARDAQKRSDSIMSEFKKVNDQLKNMNDSIIGKNDSALQELKKRPEK